MKNTKLDVLIKCLPDSPFKAQLESEINALTNDRDRLLTAAKNVRDVRGRHHSEIANTRLFALIAEIEGAQ